MDDYDRASSKKERSKGLFRRMENRLKCLEELVNGPGAPAPAPRASMPFLQTSGPFLQTSEPTRRPVSSFRSSNSAQNDPPPAYLAHAPPHRPSSNGDSDPYAFLTQFDTAFLIDDSGSMVGRSWRETQKALEAITPICTAHDADDIDPYFLNAPNNPWYRNVTSAPTVTEIFGAVQPRGGTFLGQRLQNILRPYLARCASGLNGWKALAYQNMITGSDDEPCDNMGCVQELKKFEKHGEPAWEVGFPFWPVNEGSDESNQCRQIYLNDNRSDWYGWPGNTSRKGTEYLLSQYQRHRGGHYKLTLMQLVLAAAFCMPTAAMAFTFPDLFNFPDFGMSISAAATEAWATVTSPTAMSIAEKTCGLSAAGFSFLKSHALPSKDEVPGVVEQVAWILAPACLIIYGGMTTWRQQFRTAFAFLSIACGLAFAGLCPGRTFWDGLEAFMAAGLWVMGMIFADATNGWSGVRWLVGVLCETLVGWTASLWIAIRRLLNGICPGSEVEASQV